MRASAFINGADRFSAGEFAAGRPDRGKGNVAVDGAKGGLDHLPSVIGFADDAIRGVIAIQGDGAGSPFIGPSAHGRVLEHVEVADGVRASNDDAGLVGVFPGSYGRIDGDDDALQLLRLRPAAIFNLLVGPQGARRI